MKLFGRNRKLKELRYQMGLLPDGLGILTTETRHYLNLHQLKSVFILLEIYECAAEQKSISTKLDKIRYEKEGWKEMFYLTTHSTYFIYGYMASDIW